MLQFREAMPKKDGSAAKRDARVWATNTPAPPKNDLSVAANLQHRSRALLGVTGNAGSLTTDSQGGGEWLYQARVPNPPGRLC